MTGNESSVTVLAPIPMLLLGASKVATPPDPAGGPYAIGLTKPYGCGP
jgi:hypothetical protein